MARIQISQNELCNLVLKYAPGAGKIKNVSPRGKHFEIELALNEFLPTVKLVAEFIAFNQGAIHLRLHMPAFFKLIAKRLANNHLPGVTLDLPDVFLEINQLLAPKTPFPLEIQNVVQQTDGDFMVDLQIR